MWPKYLDRSNCLMLTFWLSALPAWLNSNPPLWASPQILDYLIDQSWRGHSLGGPKPTEPPQEPWPVVSWVASPPGGRLALRRCLGWSICLAMARGVGGCQISPRPGDCWGLCGWLQKQGWSLSTWHWIPAEILAPGAPWSPGSASRLLSGIWPESAP